MKFMALKFKKALWLMVLISVQGSLAFAKPPQELKFKELKFLPPKIDRRVLSNGATLFMLPDHELPLISVSAYFHSGTMYDDPERPGIASLCGSLMRAGGTLTR